MSRSFLPPRGLYDGGARPLVTSWGFPFASGALSLRDINADGQTNGQTDGHGEVLFGVGRNSRRSPSGAAPFDTITTNGGLFGFDQNLLISSDHTRRVRPRGPELDGV